jgi:hypothetical protein
MARNQSNCSVCRHAERVRAEIALATGEQRTAVGRRFGLSPYALKRHFKAHVSEERLASLLSAKQRQEFLETVIDANEGTIEHAKGLRAGLEQRFYAVLKTATDDMVLVALGREIRQVNDWIARRTGELASSPLVSITNTQMSVAMLMESPQNAALWSMVIEALHSLPNFQEIYAVLSALANRLEGSDSGNSALPAIAHETSHVDETPT